MIVELPNVRHERSRCGKALVAHLAFVRFFSGVYERVDFQVGELGETFSAHVAQIWFFAGVDEHVPLKVAVEAEGLGADFASARQVVFPYNFPFLFNCWLFVFRMISRFVFHQHRLRHKSSVCFYFNMSCKFE